MLMCMHSTSVRIDGATHEDLKRLAAEMDTTVGNAVTLAVRALRQDRVGADLADPWSISTSVSRRVGRQVSGIQPCS
jgi:hypothetical protein